MLTRLASWIESGEQPPGQEKPCRVCSITYGESSLATVVITVEDTGAWFSHQDHADKNDLPDVDSEPFGAEGLGNTLDEALAHIVDRLDMIERGRRS